MVVTRGLVRARPIQQFRTFPCYQAPLPMRISPRLAGAKFAFFFHLRPTDGHRTASTCLSLTFIA
jgi:hypothetical protein